MPQQEIIESFYGIDNQADPYSDKAAIECVNFDISLGGDAEKTKGYTRFDYTTDSVTAIDVTAGTTADLTVADSSGYSVNDLIILYNFNDANFSLELDQKVFKVTAIPDGTTLRITYDVSGLSGTATCSIDLSIQNLGDTFISTNSVALSDIDNYGSFQYGDYLYSFLGTSTSQYLCKADVTAIVLSWEYVEATPTEFTTTQKASFQEYQGNVIFVKNEKQTISGDDGGVFYINGTALALYGTENNPTGKYIELHNERLWVGNITYQGSTAVSEGSSWTVVSKLFPTAADTTKTISAASVGSTTTLTVTAHGYSVNDVVFIEGIVGDLGTTLLNGNFYEIIAADTNTITIEAD